MASTEGFLVYLVIALCYIIRATAVKFTGTSCNPLDHNEVEVAESAEMAKKLMLKNPNINEPIPNRLAVMMLFGQGFRPATSKGEQDRTLFLQCALQKLYRNMMGKTPLDIFIWIPFASMEFIPNWIKNSTLYPRTVIMPIQNKTWLVPCNLHDDAQWPLRKHFNVEYHIMGRWRLSFAFDFVRAVGYKYYLQFDDDAMLNNFLDFNLVSRFRNMSYEMGVFSDSFGEVAHIALGMAELTRYWLTVNKFQPTGLLFEHLSPKNIDGLVSQHGNVGGWDRFYHPGYFLIVSVDFWFSELVQDYLTTIFKSGRDVEGRWQEQLVQNMIRLVFIPREKLWVMNEVDIGHDRHKRQNFENWCVKTGIIH